MSYGEMPSCYRLITRKARTEHRCCECHGVIEKGERYHYHSGVWDGSPASFKVCSDCEALREKVRIDGDLWPEETPALGCLGDDLECSHLDDFREIQRERRSNAKGFAMWLAEQTEEHAEADTTEVLGERCIDGGKCHHHCTDRCFRREACVPFSDYSGPWAYPDAARKGGS